MEDSSSSKPFMVTTSLNLKVTTPSFYNQPKKFASVAPPRPKSLTPPSASSPTPIGTGMIGRVGQMPPPPPSLYEGMNTSAAVSRSTCTSCMSNLRLVPLAAFVLFLSKLWFVWYEGVRWVRCHAVVEASGSSRGERGA